MSLHFALPPKVRLLVPVLGSPSDGEALGACRAIGRTLHGAGLDFHDMAKAIRCRASPKGTRYTKGIDVADIFTTDEARQKSFTERQLANHRRMARYCRDHDSGRLSARERSFVWTIADHPGDISISQADWLTDITDRLEQEDRRA